MHSIASWWMWIGFFVLIFSFLSCDIFLFGGKRPHKVSMREASFLVTMWVSLALLFNLFLWWYLKTTAGSVVANQKSLEFLTGYLIEESLSVDNMFVFLTIFSYFAVKPEYQRRVLVIGIVSAIIFRLIMILLGTWLVSQFHWILYVFGVFLVLTGIKLLFSSTENESLENNIILNFLRRHLRVTENFHEEHFFIRRNNLWYATPLFLVLVLIEISDLIFALDSIPAIFAVTDDPFIIFTSNVFAILGLRALYFMLAGMAEKFPLLKYGIAIMLTFIGVKMLIAPWVKIPILLALSIVVSILFTTVILSLLVRKTR